MDIEISPIKKYRINPLAASLRRSCINSLLRVFCGSKLRTVGIRLSPIVYHRNTTVTRLPWKYHCRPLPWKYHCCPASTIGIPLSSLGYHRNTIVYIPYFQHQQGKWKEGTARKAGGGRYDHLIVYFTYTVLYS